MSTLDSPMTEPQPFTASPSTSEVEIHMTPESSAEMQPSQAVAAPQLVADPENKTAAFPFERRKLRKKNSKHHLKTKRSQTSPVSYQPDAIILRLQKKPGLIKAYQEDARVLYLHIRQWGLGMALSLLLSHPQTKRKQRLYRDLSKWLVKERQLKGKNKRSLIESVIYGDPLYLLQATEASLNYLETILHLASTAPVTKNNDTLPAAGASAPLETAAESTSSAFLPENSAMITQTSSSIAAALNTAAPIPETVTTPDINFDEGQQEPSIHV